MVKTSRSRNLVKYAGITAVAVGATLILASFLWKSMISQDTLLTTEQAEAYINSAGQFHNDSFNTQEGGAALEASRAAYAAQRAQLESAFAFRDRTPLYLRIAGFLASAGGAGLLYAVNRKTPKKKSKASRPTATSSKT